MHASNSNVSLVLVRPKHSILTTTIYTKMNLSTAHIWKKKKKENNQKANVEWAEIKEDYTYTVEHRRHVSNKEQEGTEENNERK